MKFRRDAFLTDDEQALYDTAVRRFAKLPKLDILDWTDQAGSGMARALDDYRRLGMPESVAEAKMGALAVLAAIRVLGDRHD